MNRDRTTPQIRFGPALEILGERLLPSIAIGANRTLVVEGTEQRDVIVVERLPGSVDDLRVTVYDGVSGAVRERREGPEYDLSGADTTVTSVRLRGLGDNDVLINWTVLPGELLGGYGNDSLQGGFAPDTLDGGEYPDGYIYSTRPFIEDARYRPYVPAGIVINDADPAWGTQLGTDTIRDPDTGGEGNGWLDLTHVGSSATVDLGRRGLQTVAAGLKLQGLAENAGGLRDLYGTPLDDVLFGNARQNVISGDSGNDRIAGGGGDDTLAGQWGDDTYVFNGGPLGHDSVQEYGTPGAADALDFSTFGAAVVAGRSRQHGPPDGAGLLSLTLNYAGRSNLENVVGTAFDDRITGSDLANRLDGGRGNDTLSGLGGRDTLIGGWGSDALLGGTEDDTLYGLYIGAPRTIIGYQDADVFIGGDGTDHEEDYYVTWNRLIWRGYLVVRVD